MTVKSSWNSRKIMAAILPAAITGLERTAEEVAAEALVQVPRDEEKLAESMEMTPAENGQAITISFGGSGPASAYAARQHEDLTLAHPNGGKAKYLEDSMKTHGTKLAENVAEEIRRVLG
jgi:hypothetical protein